MKINQYKTNARNWNEFERNQERVKRTAEVFTPTQLVQKMCNDYHEHNNGDWSGDMLDPASGSGNILSEILLRKILFYSGKTINDDDAEIPPHIHHKATNEIYGVDIMKDNVKAVRERLWLPEDNENVIENDYLEIYSANPLFNPNKVSTRKFKAIFANPPYSKKSREERDGKIDLWNRFAEMSLKASENIYFITPYIWNGHARRLQAKMNKMVGYVDLTAGKHFDVAMSVSYWNTAKRKGCTVKTEKEEIEIEQLDEIQFIPYKIDETLSIHRKVWTKNKMKVKVLSRIHSHANKRLMKRKDALDTFHHSELTNENEDDEFKYKVFHLNPSKFYYTTKEGIEKYGIDEFESPKIVIGVSSDNTPFFDRKGEYATTHNGYVIFDTLENLENRFKQLNTNFTKFLLETARQDMGGSSAGLLYHSVLRLFPDIPLSITTDEGIFEWLGLTDEEIAVVNKFAVKVDKRDERRQKKQFISKKMQKK